MLRLLISLLFLSVSSLQATTIAIIDTGFDLDNEFLKPKIFKQETDEETIDPGFKEFEEWQFHDNSHLKEAVIKDQASIQEILLYRSLRAKGHKEGLTLQEFEWFKKRSSNKTFMEMVRQFKKHSHGTFVAGIALREGENISLFPIRGLNIPIPMVAVEDNTIEGSQKLLSKTPEEKFQEEMKNSLNRVTRKFTKICRYLSLNQIHVVNASYGITYKNIVSKLREKYLEITGKEIDEPKLQEHVKQYFETLFKRSSKTIARYPRTLFIFSAGNSGLDNDQFDHYPSKIKLPNTIAVAAMNGDYLASFSNYGATHVDIGAPGVAILSLVPKVYSPDGRDLYSPSSGTSMAAPYISNLAAQIMNANSQLNPQDIKRIIMETGDEKPHLKGKLTSGAIANNQKALKAATLSKEMGLNESIALAKSDLLMPMEDTISIGQPPAISAESLHQRMMESIPHVIPEQDLDESEEQILPPAPQAAPKPVRAPKFPTSEESLKLSNPMTEQPDNSVPPPSTDSTPPKMPSIPIPSNQSEEQSPPPDVETPSSSSPDSPQPDQTPAPTPSPSSP